MAVTRAKITENDYIELLSQVGRWPAGTRGTAVSDYGDYKLVEISDDRGQMLDLLDIPEDQLKLIQAFASS